MEAAKGINSLQKLETIFQTINILIERSTMLDKTIGFLTVNEIKEIIEEQKIFDDIDMEKISSFSKKYIRIEEFEDNSIFYDILYEIFLNKMYKFSSENKDSTTLFNTFNQAYYYKKYINYLYEFIKKYPETLYDDIIKEKLFEIVHSLESDDKLYREDFYFYISICHIRECYQKNEISIPEFQKFNNTSFENSNTDGILREIQKEKISVIKNFIQLIAGKKSKSKNNLFEMLVDVKKEITDNNSFKEERFDYVQWNDMIMEKEKNFINYLQENKQDNDVIKIYNHLKVNAKLEEKFEFYFIDKMESFLPLPQEDKYIIINSYDDVKGFYNQYLDFKSLKESYDKGMNEENNLKKIIKGMIESKEFFNDIKEIFTSEKVLDYIKNPLQYIKGETEIYDEKEEEKKKYKKSNKNEPINKFNNECDQESPDNKEKYNFETEGFPDLLSKTLEEELKFVEEEEYKCQFQIDYEYFMNKIFNEDFFKKRIIYSFMPIGIKACVSSIPKIILNVCGNNVISYINKENCEEYKKVLKALYTVINLHELIHLIRRENPKESITNEYTPKTVNCNYEGGKSFIYHIFGGFPVLYIGLEFANVILNRDSWTKKSKELKKQFLRFKGKKDDDIINSLKMIGGIKCYDAIIEEDADSDEEEDFCYKLTI